MDLVLSLKDQNGLPPAVFAEVRAGETVKVWLTEFGGTKQVALNGLICEGAFDIKDHVRTVFVLHVDDAGCAVDVTREEPLGEQP
jgi:hypothetical protein